MSWLLAALLVAVLPCGLLGALPDDRIFDFDGSKNIVEEEHFGIVNGLATIGVNYKTVGSMSGLWSPPFASSDFAFLLQIDGKDVPNEKYTWRPFQVVSAGGCSSLKIDSVITLIYGIRGGVVAVTIENDAAQKVVPFDAKIAGTVDRIEEWGFPRPMSKTPAPAKADARALVKGDQIVVAVRTNLDNPAWNEETSTWHGALSLGPHEKRSVCFAFAMGARGEAVRACEAIMANPEKAIAGAREEYARRVHGLFDKLPRLESDNAALVSLYNRSLVHLIMNRWDVPEFLLHPYYSTGSVKGGCVCDYLWDFGEPWEIMPLFDPAALREHIKQFLKIDLTAHFAFDPITGAAQGPWYMVNQEKIIGIVYYYVLETGDTNFLNEEVNGKSILDWVIQNALYGDDVNKPIALIDYGPSNSHLELRRGYPYNHVMSDLNGRRYMNYQMASELAQLAGKPLAVLMERAQLLKPLLKKELWDVDKKWFAFEDERGKKDFRYTIQMFKLFNSPVLDAEEEAGLLSHLNETEFLSAQGLHSMSKTDIAYDQVDIDNGGGGSYTAFPPQIAERLYKCGHADKADDIMGRILWWGERMPYWGDSLVANSIDYRKDTPLQCSISGATIAQCIIFGLCGVEAKMDGSISINPHSPPFAPDFALKNLKLRGKSIDIQVSSEKYRVECDGKSVDSIVGKKVVIP